jgi:major capsid protein gp7
MKKLLLWLFSPAALYLERYLTAIGAMQWALIGASALTFADWARRMDDDGKVATIVNLLSQSNEVLKDILVIEANQATSHKTTVRTGLPTATWRLLNYGVAQTKSTTAQVVDNCGNLETYATIDRDIADLNGNTAEFRLSEDLAFLEGMNQQVAGVLFYGNTAANPERFMGFAPRYNTVLTATAQTAANVIDAGGTGSTNTSIWVVVWGPNTMAGFFPKGKISGLQHRDLGEWTVYDANNNPYQAYRTHFKWELGLTVRDWRYAVRIANIDVTLLSTGSAANLINALIRAVHRLPTAPVGVSTEQDSDAPDKGAMSMGQTVIYCNRVIRTYLDIQAVNKTNVLLKLEQWQGMTVTTFRGVPIRTVDQLLNTEARLV